MLDRQISVNVFPGNGGERIDRVIYTALPVPAPPPSVRLPSPEPSPSPVPAVPSQVAQMLSTFITQHHQKSSRGDVSGLVNDYADQVDHFDHGIVDREFIRKDELDYHSPGTRVTEVIITAPTFKSLGDGEYFASYSLSFLQVRRDRHWMKGISDVQMQIQITPSGPRIAAQKSFTHDQQKGR